MNLNIVWQLIKSFGNWKYTIVYITCETFQEMMDIIAKKGLYLSKPLLRDSKTFQMVEQNFFHSI